MNEKEFESNTDALHAEDLLALERRRHLSEHEQRRLGMCLTASDALRMLRQLHQDFEALAPTMGDDARVTEQCVSAVRQRFATTKNGAKRRSLWRMGSLMGASAVLLTLAAAAALYRSVPGRLAPNSAATAAGVVAANGQGQGQAHEVTAASTQQVTTPPNRLPPVNRTPASIASPSTPRFARASNDGESITSDSRSSVELFAAANSARRNGDTQKAITLYQRLQAQYPSSEEAVVSHVLLARLELGRGAAALALRDFEAYLEQVPRGSLSQEALQGKAEALSRLGRKEEEAAAWRRLLEEFPNSVYAQSAREHLGEGARQR